MKEVKGTAYTHPSRTAASNGLIAVFSSTSNYRHFPRQGCDSRKPPNNTFFLAVPSVVEKGNLEGPSLSLLSSSGPILANKGPLIPEAAQDGGLSPLCSTVPNEHPRREQKNRKLQRTQLELSIYHCLADWNTLQRDSGSSLKTQGVSTQKIRQPVTPVTATLLHRIPIDFSVSHHAGGDGCGGSGKSGAASHDDVDLLSALLTKQGKASLSSFITNGEHHNETSMKSLSETGTRRKAQAAEEDDRLLTIDKISWISRSTVALLNAKGDLLVLRSGFSTFDRDEEDDEEDEEGEDGEDEPDAMLANAAHIIDFTGGYAETGVQQSTDAIFASSNSKGLLAWLITWEGKGRSSRVSPSPRVVEKTFPSERYSYAACTPVPSPTTSDVDSEGLMLLVGCSSRSSVVLSTRSMSDLQIRANQEILLGPEQRFLGISISSAVETPSFVRGEDKKSRELNGSSSVPEGRYTDSVYRVYIALIGAEESLGPPTQKSGTEAPVETDTTLMHTLKGKNGVPLCVDIKESVFDILQQRQLNQLYRSPVRSEDLSTSGAAGQKIVGAEHNNNNHRNNNVLLSDTSSSILSTEALLTSSLVVTPPDIRHGGFLHLLQWDSTKQRCVERHQYAFSAFPEVTTSLTRIMGSGSSTSRTLRLTPQLLPVFQQTENGEYILQSVEVGLFDKKKASVKEEVQRGSGGAGGCTLCIPIRSHRSNTVPSPLGVGHCEIANGLLQHAEQAISLKGTNWDPSIGSEERVGLQGRKTADTSDEISAEVLGLQCISRNDMVDSKHLYVVLAGIRDRKMEMVLNEANENEKRTSDMSTEEKRDSFFGEGMSSNENASHHQSAGKKKSRVSANIYSDLALQFFTSPTTSSSRPQESQKINSSAANRQAQEHMDPTAVMHESLTSALPPSSMNSLEAMFRRVLKEEHESLLHQLRGEGMTMAHTTPSLQNHTEALSSGVAPSEKGERSHVALPSVSLRQVKKDLKSSCDIQLGLFGSKAEGIVPEHEKEDFASRINALWKACYSPEAFCTTGDTAGSRSSNTTLLRNLLQHACGEGCHSHSSLPVGIISAHDQLLAKQLITWMEAFDTLCMKNGEVLTGEEQGRQSMLKLGEGLVTLLSNK